MELPGAKNSQLLAAVFMVITFIATFLAGLFGGVAFITVFFRSLLFSILLGMVGFGAGMMLERFAPEAWNGTSADSNGSQDDSVDSGGEQENGAGGMVDFTVGQDESISNPPPPPPPKTDFSDLPDGDEHVNIPPPPPKKGGEVVGNYRIIDDKQFPDDPEDYAKAIRTMMKKDE